MSTMLIGRDHQPSPCCGLLYSAGTKDLGAESKAGWSY